MVYQIFYKNERKNSILYFQIFNLKEKMQAVLHCLTATMKSKK
jgi:hypothetical protein